MGEGGLKLVIIGGVAAIALLLGCLGILGAVQLSGLGPKTTTQTEAAAREGAEVGRDSEVLLCISESLEREDACGSLDPVCQLEVSAWSAGCLSEARDPGGHCKDAPSPMDTEASVDWATQTCADLGDPEGCLTRLGPIQQLCALSD